MKIIEYQKKVNQSWQWERCPQEEADCYIVEDGRTKKGVRVYKRIALRASSLERPSTPNTAFRGINVVDIILTA